MKNFLAAIVLLTICFSSCTTNQSKNFVCQLTDPWGLNVVQENSYSETPCIVYAKEDLNYVVDRGDCFYTVFGCPATKKHSQKSNRIYPGQKVKFCSTDITSLVDVKSLWSSVGRDTMFLVIRDRGEAYLIFKKDEFSPDVVVWSSKISVGKKHKKGESITPTGMYTIGRKNRWARSISYNAPMYFGNQLFKNNQPTNYWIHQGYVTGEPASHGCVRVPKAWAAELWNLSYVGLPVVITDMKSL